MTAADSHPLQGLIALLDLEPIEENLFRGQNAPGRHVFGGQVLGQAIVAASRTVDPTRRLHSLHSYFLRRGDHARPILFEVDRIRDGGSFTTRRVVGIQHGRAIFNMSASFQIEEHGLEHQTETPEAPDPESLESDFDYYRRLAESDPMVKRFLPRFQAIDSRQVEGIHMYPREGRDQLPPAKSTWMRIKERLDEDPVLHQAMLAYMSDMDFMSVSMLPHGPRMVGYTIQGASLDHAMWFHRPFRADEWLLFVKESPFSGGARGYVRGAFYDRERRVVASVAQECLIRLREKDAGVET